MITSQPDSTGHFGPYGGRFVPEVLMAQITNQSDADLFAHYFTNSKVKWSPKEQADGRENHYREEHRHPDA